MLYQIKKLRTRLMKVITRKKLKSQLPNGSASTISEIEEVLISKGIVQTEENHIHLVHTETVHNLYPRQLVLDLTFRRLRRQNVATFSQKSSFFIKQPHSSFNIYNQSAVC